MYNLLCVLILSMVIGPPDSVKAVDDSETLDRVRIGDKWGFADSTGKMVIDPIFDFTWGFSEELAAVKVGDKKGYINREGEIIVEPQFDEAWSFSEGLARVKIGRKWGYIDRAGDMVIKPQFDYAQSFLKGLAMVQNEGSWRYIDKNGQYIKDTGGSGRNTMNGLPPPPSGVVEQRPELVHSVSPVYPKDAWKARLTGKVILRFLVETDGRVSNVTVLRGREVFRQAAINALMRFRFKPAQIDGEPISVWMTQAISFNLK